jgi:hypothetical protein
LNRVCVSHLQAAEHGQELQAFQKLLQEQHVVVPTPMLYNKDLDALCHRWRHRVAAGGCDLVHAKRLTPMSCRFLRARKYVVTAAWNMFTSR